MPIFSRLGGPRRNKMPKRRLLETPNGLSALRQYAILQGQLDERTSALSMQSLSVPLHSEKKSDVKSEETRQQAQDMYLEGLGFRAIGRVLKVSHTAVYSWIKQAGKAEWVRSFLVANLGKMRSLPFPFKRESRAIKPVA